MALISLSTAGLTYTSTMNSSAIFDKVGVREMGPKCLLTCRSGFCLGKAVSSINTGTITPDKNPTFGLSQDGGNKYKCRKQS